MAVTTEFFVYIIGAKFMFLPDFLDIRCTVFPLIEAGSQIQAGGQTSFVLIEAGSLIQARSLTEAGGSKRRIS